MGVVTPTGVSRANFLIRADSELSARSGVTGPPRAAGGAVAGTADRAPSGRMAHRMWTHLATEGTLVSSTAQIRYHPGGMIVDWVGKVIDPFVSGRDR